MENYNRIEWESCKLGQDVYTYHFGEQKMVLFGKVVHIEANADGFHIHINHIKSGHVVKMFKAKDYGVEEIKKFAKNIKLDVKYLLGEKYEGDLYLSSVKTLPENIQFNVGGYLILSSVESLSANIVFNVGGYLWLSSVQSLPANIVFNVIGNIHFPKNRKVKILW